MSGRLVNPEGTEAAAILALHDLPTCRSAEDAGVLAELMGIGAALQPKDRQSAEERPCEAHRGQPHPEPAEIAPSLPAGLSCGAEQPFGSFLAVAVRFMDGILG